MAIQTIDTERVAAAITHLKNVNRNINSAFTTMEQASKNALEWNWKSPAGDSALTALLELLEINKARDAVLQNYTTLLEQQVSPGYTNVEATNKSLASQFK